MSGSTERVPVADRLERAIDQRADLAEEISAVSGSSRRGDPFGAPSSGWR